MSAKELKEIALINTVLIGEPLRVKPDKDSSIATGQLYVFTADEMQAFEEAIIQDYEDYMTDRISLEPGKIFDRKETIKEFLKQL